MLRCLNVDMNECAVSVEDMFAQARVSPEKTSTPCCYKVCLGQVLKAAPVLIVRHGRKTVVVDVHEYYDVLGSGHVLADLLCMCDEEPGTDSEEETLDDESGCSSSESESTVDEEQVDLTGEDQVADQRCKRGRPAKHVQFPALVEETVRFLELHGSAAHTRRRKDVGKRLSVKLADLQKHLLLSISGLRAKGISRSAVHR